MLLDKELITQAIVDTSCPGATAASRRMERYGSRIARQPQVTDLGPAFAVDHDVGGLEIAMQHPGLTGCRQAGADLSRELYGLAAR